MDGRKRQRTASDDFLTNAEDDEEESSVREVYSGVGQDLVVHDQDSDDE